MLKNPYGNIEELTKLIEDRRAGGDHHSADVDILMEQVKGTREAPTFGSATRTERWYNPTQWLGMGNDERLALAKDIAALKQAKEFNKALGGFTQKEILELTKRPEGFKLTNENLHSALMGFHFLDFEQSGLIHSNLFLFQKENLPDSKGPFLFLFLFLR